MKKLTIAIDGPAGAGKSTLAKLVAKKLGYSYLESGFLYRALTYEALRRSINLENEKALIRMAAQAKIECKKTNGEWHIFLNNEDISKEIKTPEIDESVARIGRIEGVRKEVLKFQRRMAKKGGIVVEGRDIGTVVFPKADKKFYIDASLETRAKRKYKELQAKGYKTSLSQVLREIQERDGADMIREISPLKKPPDALRIDTTQLAINEGVAAILREITKTNKKWILYSILHAIGRFLFKLFFRVEVSGSENIPETGPVLIVPNHLSFLDPPLIGVAAPRRLHYMTIDIVAGFFFIGNLCRRTGAFPIKRGGVGIRGMKKALEILKDKEAVLIFIEGKRSPSGRLLKPKSGVGMIAYRSGAVVIPTLIIGSNRALPYGSKFIRPRKIRISFGSPLTIERFSQLRAKEAYRVISNEIIDRIKEMQGVEGRGN